VTRRRFNSSERVALYLAEGGACALCGVVLGKGWHADHVAPWATGGDTDVVNGQALCPGCNLEKGAKMASELRKWQEEAIRKYWDHKEKDFLAEATPGAGKTRFAAEICARLYEGDIVDRIVWVVPSTRLRKQTSDAVREATGLQLHYLWENGDTVFPDSGFAGIVVTYQAVASAAPLYRTITSRMRTLVILDEVHHAAAGKSWGAALKSAFEPAVKRLLLSGTPFRSDDHAIPFVRYVERQGQSDYIYGYADALTDDVVRSVYFPRIGGRMEWTDNKGDWSATFEEKLDEAGQSRRLKTALAADGGHLGGMLAQAHRELVNMREEDPDAAGLVIAMDQYHANAIADRMRRELSVDPVVAISDEPDAGVLIERFATGRAPWIVAVRMVSEGVDIPRLRIGVYATNVVTELFFRQAVGRVIRRDDHGDASFYIPDDPRLRMFAAEIQQQRDSVDLSDEDDTTKPRDDEDTDGTVSSLFMPLSSTATHEGIIAGDHQLSAEEIARAQKIKLTDRVTARLPDAVVALLLRNAGMSVPAAVAPSQPPVSDLTERIRLLKTRNNKASRSIAYNRSLDYAEVNRTLNARVGIRSVITCTDPALLEKRLALAIRWRDSGDLGQAAGA